MTSPTDKVPRLLGLPTSRFLYFPGSCRAKAALKNRPANQHLWAQQFGTASCPCAQSKALHSRFMLLSVCSMAASFLASTRLVHKSVLCPCVARGADICGRPFLCASCDVVVKCPHRRQSWAKAFLIFLSFLCCTSSF